jgi:CCR4-NOT transcriptional regulation complex NOT5 subunit
MSKKDFIVQVLDTIQNKWHLAKDLKRFIVMWALDNEAINALIELFRDMAKYMKNKELQARVLTIANKLENMKELELQESIWEQAEIEQLLVNL